VQSMHNGSEEAVACLVEHQAHRSSHRKQQQQQATASSEPSYKPSDSLSRRTSQATAASEPSYKPSDHPVVVDHADDERDDKVRGLAATTTQQAQEQDHRRRRILHDYFLETNISMILLTRDGIDTVMDHIPKDDKPLNLKIDRHPSLRNEATTEATSNHVARATSQATASSEPSYKRQPPPNRRTSQATASSEPCIGGELPLPAVEVNQLPLLWLFVVGMRRKCSLRCYY
jgi:hypothetical protein